jgi:hypothetical protein
MTARVISLEAQRVRRGLACPDGRNPDGSLACGPTGKPGVGATLSQALPGMVLVFGLPTAAGAGIGALVGGEKHRVAGGVVGGLVGLAGVFAFTLFSGFHDQ